MSTTATPADQDAHHRRVAATYLSAAARTAKSYEDAPEQNPEVRIAAAAVRLLAVGALTDPTVNTNQGRNIVRTHLRDLVHGGGHPRAVTAVYRACFNAIDGKV